MLLPLALLIIAAQTPIWIAMIFFPGSAPAHALLQAAAPYRPHAKPGSPTYRIEQAIALLTDWKVILIGVGVLFIFLVIGTLAYALSYTSTASNALAAITSDSKSVSADNAKIAADALRNSANLPSTLIAILLGTTIFDFMTGILAFREMIAVNVPAWRRSAVLLIMFVLGPISAIVFGLWMILRQAAPKPAETAQE